MTDGEIDLPIGTFATIGGAEHAFVAVDALVAARGGDPRRLPYTLRILIENVVRNSATNGITAEDVDRLCRWRPGAAGPSLPLTVSRVILPDSSGLPVLMDLAALRSAVAQRGGDPAAVQPRIPVDLVIDHSLIVDFFGTANAMQQNVGREYGRNGERYSFFKWAGREFRNVQIVPPGMGIIHQVHLEKIAELVVTSDVGGVGLAHPELVLGGDSHTPMVNGLGVMAWGVGGVEAEAAMLGYPYVCPVPRMIGVRLSGALRAGATTTDIALTFTEVLRKFGVVNAFVELTGSAYASLSVADRATLANMCPEYGATAAYCPIDENALAYLRQTGRSEDHVRFIEVYARAAGLFREPDAPEPLFDQVIEIDLSSIEPSLSGPTRPQDRVPLPAVKRSFADFLSARRAGASDTSASTQGRDVAIAIDGRQTTLRDGSLVIAAITACTNTSNPSVMIAAGLLAKKAVEAGLVTPPYVKTSLAPGSRVVTQYLRESGLLPYLEQLGFFVVGYGCTTCSGKSGPLPPPVSAAVEENGLVTAAVISSNRNFEGRIHRQVRAIYLASPPLVVAYALAGRIDLDLTREPIGVVGEKAIHLADLWPSSAEIAAHMALATDPRAYTDNYRDLFKGTEDWETLPTPEGVLFPWQDASTYIVEPPFFSGDRNSAQTITDRLDGVRALGVFGDGLSTEHVIPSGEIPADSAAGAYLIAEGVAPRDFNAYTQRRGNHNVMMRGTFAHALIQNRMSSRRGGFTVKMPEADETTIYAAAEQYRAEGTPLIVFGGQNYGMGSSRDWAAKGPALLGVRAVIAESIERIHRSNLVAVGIVPLLFEPGTTLVSLGLTGREAFSIEGLRSGIETEQPVRVSAVEEGQPERSFQVRAAIESAFEKDLLLRGGIFSAVLEEFASSRN